MPGIVDEVFSEWGNAIPRDLKGQSLGVHTEQGLIGSWRVTKEAQVIASAAPQPGSEGPTSSR